MDITSAPPHPHEAGRKPPIFGFAGLAVKTLFR